MESSNNSGNPSVSPRGTNAPVGNNPFSSSIPSPFSGVAGVNPFKGISSPTMGDGGAFRGGMPDFSSLNQNTNPFANNPAAQNARINPSPFNGGMGGSTVGGAGGATGTDSMNFKNVMRTLTTELQNFTRLLQNVNRGGGGMGGPGGGGGGGSFMPAGIRAEGNGRFRDINTGRYVSSADVQTGFQRVFGQMGMMRGPQGMGGAPGMGGMGTTGLPTAPLSITAQMAAGGNFTSFQHNTFAALQAGGNPVLAKAAANTAAMHPGTTFVNPTLGTGRGGAVANTFKQQTLAVAGNQQMVNQPGGYYGPGGRGGLENFVRGFVGRPGQMGQQVAVPSVSEVMTDLNMPNTPGNKDAAQRYVNQMKGINQGVATNQAQTSRGAAVRRGVGTGMALAGNFAGSSLSQISAGIPYIGGFLSSVFSVGEGAANMADLEFPMGVAQIAQGRTPATRLRGRRGAFKQLASYGVGGPEALAMGTAFGVASGGMRLGNLGMGLIAGGLDAGSAGMITGGMYNLGTGFASSKSTFGFGAMGAAARMGITGAGAQFQFATALQGAGQGILGAGVGFDASRLTAQADVIRQGGRLRGLDALSMATQGVMGNVQSSQNIGATVFGGSQLYDMMSFANAFKRTGSLRGARRLMEGETATDTRARLQGAFGATATEFAMLGKFTEFQTTEFERSGAGTALDPTAGTAMSQARAKALKSSTKLSKQKVGIEAQNLDVLYQNQDKVMTIMKENIQLQKQLLSSLSGQNIKDISKAILDMNSVVTSGLGSIASGVASLVNMIGSIAGFISSWVGGGKKPPTPPSQQKTKQSKQAKGKSKSAPPAPPVNKGP